MASRSLRTRSLSLDGRTDEGRIVGFVMRDAASEEEAREAWTFLEHGEGRKEGWKR